MIVYKYIHYYFILQATLDFFFGLGAIAGSSVGSFLFTVYGGFALPFWTLGIMMMLFGVLVLLMNNQSDLKEKNISENKLVLLSFFFASTIGVANEILRFFY